MAEVQGELYFAPGRLMRDVPLGQPEALLVAFIDRITGFFLSPIEVLEESPRIEGALFASALLVAALIESVARVDGTAKVQDDAPIRTWLERHIPTFQSEVTHGGQTFSVAAIFEQRFRNGLVHNGYVASLGRLSRDIDEPVTSNGRVVTVNPFRLAQEVGEAVKQFAADLRGGERDLRAFAHGVETQFREEVEWARKESTS